MNNDLLRDVIAVEKEIQQNIERTQQDARIWLESREKELEVRCTREERAILESLLADEEQAKEDAARRTSELIKTAEEQAGRLAEITDEALDLVAAIRMRSILPGYIK